MLNSMGLENLFKRRVLNLQVNSTGCGVQNHACIFNWDALSAIAICLMLVCYMIVVSFLVENTAL